MRIDCEKCGAAFAIEDRLVPPKGVRAQCPRCRNIQLVKKPEVAPAAAPSPKAPVAQVTAAPTTSRSSSPALAPAPGASKAGAGSQSPSSPKVPAWVPPESPPVHTPESGVPAQLAQTLKAKSTSGRTQAASAKPPAAAVEANAAAVKAAKPPTVSDEPPTAQARQSSEPPTMETLLCSSCRRVLGDAFDKALGTCDACRAKAAPAEAPAAPFSPLNRMAPPRTAARPGSEPKRWPRVVGGVGAVLLVGAGALFVLKPFEPKAAIDRPVPAAVMSVLPRWKLSFMGVTGSSAEQIKDAEVAMQLDTPGGYLDAEEAFQKALLLDPDSDAAIVGYVRALSLGRGATMDEATFQEALLLIDAARSRMSDAPQTLVAEAQLRLTRTQPEHLEKARALAERALAGSDTLSQGEAHLVLGRTYVATSLALALQHFDKAMELAPQLSRVQLFRAHAYEESGDIQKALAALRDRLKSDPDHPGALEALSRLYQESGDTDAAREVYQRVLEQRPSDFRANLMLGVLKYQAEGKAAEAAKALSLMAKDPERYDERDRVELLTHLSASQRASGDLTGAALSAQTALSVDAADPGAHLQALLIALDGAQQAEALVHLPFVSGHLGDAGLERMLSARVRLAEGKTEEAAQLYKEAAKLDARRTDAVIMAGVALAVAKKREQALTALSPLESVDPLRSAPRAVVSRFYLPANETLKDAGLHVLKLARSEDDVTPRVFQGLIHWHRGEHADAAKLFREVIEADTRNVAAQAYLALIDERRGDFQRAKQAAERAVSGDKRNAVAHYALGTALQGLGDRDGARREYQQAEAFAPSLIAASLRIAQLDAAAGQKDRARERLSRALNSDPSYLPAKQILYVLSIGGGTP